MLDSGLKIRGLKLAFDGFGFTWCRCPRRDFLPESDTISLPLISCILIRGIPRDTDFTPSKHWVHLLDLLGKYFAVHQVGVSHHHWDQTLKGRHVGSAGDERCLIFYETWDETRKMQENTSMIHMVILLLCLTPAYCPVWTHCCDSYFNYYKEVISNNWVETLRPNNAGLSFSS